MKYFFTILISLSLSLVSKSQDILKSVKDSTLYSFFSEWIGIKYRTGGNNKRGVDCSGFSKIFYETLFKMRLPRIAKEQYKFTERIKKTNLLIGDLVFFRTRSRSGWHVGVYLFDGYFIHSENQRTGVKINNLSDPYYRKTYLSGGRKWN